MRPFHRFALAFSTTFVLTGLPSLLHADWHGNVNGMLGAKRLEKRWEPIDSQPSIGVMSDFRQGEWPLSLALDLFYSGDEGTAKGVSLDGSTVEANIGLRKIFRATRAMRPYVGVGSSFVYASLKGAATGAPSRSDSDTGAGVWIGGGIYWTLADAFNVGFNLKYSNAKVTLLDERFDAGGRTFGTIIGYNF